MADIDQNKIEGLKAIRSLDGMESKEKTPQSEALNPEEVRKWLEANKYTPDTVDSFKERFTINQALAMLESSPTAGEKKLAEQLRSAQEHLARIYHEKKEESWTGASALGEKDLIEDTNADTFASTLKKELTARGELSEESTLLDAYRKYHTIKKFALDSLLTQKMFQEQRSGEKGEMEKKEAEKSSESFEKKFTDTWKDVKKGFSKMSGTEKFMTVAGGILGTYLLFSKSENSPKWQKFKDTIIGGIKIGGAATLVGFLFNQGYKMLSKTGKPGIDAAADFFGDATDTVKDAVTGDNKWTEIYNTDAKKAAILEKSVVYMGDLPFTGEDGLAAKYRAAKTGKKKEIALDSVAKGDMTPAEIYTALDVFFQKDPTVQLEKRYQDSTWIQVVSSQTTEQLDLDNESFLEAAKNVAREAAIRPWNWFMTGEGLGLIRPLYLWQFGADKKPNKEELQTFVQEYFANNADNSSELPKYVERKFPQKEHEGFKNLLEKGKKDASGATVWEDNDSLFLMAKVDTQMNSQGDVDFKTLEAANAQMVEAVKNAPFSNKMDGDFQKFIIPRGGVRVLSDGMYRYFARVPKVDSAEFNKIKWGIASGDEIASRGNEELFSEDTPIKYEKMLEERPWDAEKLRIRFLLDSTQTAELQAICDWFTDEYKNQGTLTVKEVYAKMFSDNEREGIHARALKEAKVGGKSIEQKLASNSALLNKLEDGTMLEDGIEDIENEAVAGFEGSQEARNALLELMRQRKGNKVRLAILGDTQSRSETKFNDYEKVKMEFMDQAIPFNGKSFLEDYKEWCESFIAQRNKGIQQTKYESKKIG